MKIRFVLGQLIFNLIFDLKEVEEAQKKYSGIACFSKEECEKVRRLEINPVFKKEILKTRKNIGIPVEGLDYDDFKSYYYPFNMSVSNNPDLVRNRNEFSRKVDDEINRIFDEYDCDHFVERQIKSILLSNVVLPSAIQMSDFGGISIHSVIGDDENDTDENITNEEAVFIKITSRVSPEAIINFIVEKQKELKSLLGHLPRHIKEPLTDEELSIYKMRDGNNKTPFNDIEAKLAIKTESGYSMPSSTIRQYYSRDIKVLFRKKRQKSTRKVVTK